MANFNEPFGNNSGRRLPTADEKINGFPCGPADQTLFNGLFHRIEAELGNLISFAGLTGSDADNAQVRKAVEALISAATGGGDTSTYLLMSQASARLPIYPEIVSTDGVINITSPATGSVRVPGGVELIHRGINSVTNDQTDFNTQANKTYHVRWNPTDGLSLKDLSDSSYNSGNAPETSSAFDSTYDDVLLARVVTNSSNVATITNLANKHELKASGTEVGPNGSLSTYQYEDQVTPANITQYTTVNLNWARVPDCNLTALNDVLVNAQQTGELNIGVRPLSRYDIAVWGQGDIDMYIGWQAKV